MIKAASGLKEGDISEVVSVLDPATYQNKFYIVKVTKKAEKASDWKKYKKRLKEIVLAEKTQNIDFQNKVIAKALDKANVKIKDQAFANILAQYANTDKKASKANTSKSDQKHLQTQARIVNLLNLSQKNRFSLTNVQKALYWFS